MHLFTKNINTAFETIVKLFHEGDARNPNEHRLVKIVPEPSRNGNVLRIDQPVLITYERPRERVLFNQARDASPFLHLYEALYILAGRNDVAPLAYYTKQMNEYSDDGVTLNGAYGHRWRKAQQKKYNELGELEGWNDDVDQLKILIDHLKSNPFSRRAVLSMWSVEDDLLKIGFGGKCNCGADRTGPSAEAHSNNCSAKEASRDVCCNLNVMFSIRKEMHGSKLIDNPHGPSRYREVDNLVSVLDITVTNRSNDAIWGLLGTNVVTFSILQEYVAAHLGIEVGLYHHISNNVHVYENNFKPEEWIEAEEGENNLRYYPEDRLFPLVADPAIFDKELPDFVEVNRDRPISIGANWGWKDPFLQSVAQPMMHAFHQHKRRNYELAIVCCKKIAADDWRRAATYWIQRRKKTHEQRNKTESALLKIGKSKSLCEVCGGSGEVKSATSGDGWTLCKVCNSTGEVREC